MIKIENVKIYGCEEAIHGMRNSFNSWAKSDSYQTVIENKTTGQTAPFEFFIGEKDLSLMARLAASGAPERKFMRFITVYFDITAPLYWWKQMDTYKIAVDRNSCSTMHTITERDLTLDDFSHEHLIDINRKVLESTIKAINDSRAVYLKYDGHEEELKRNFNIDTQKDIWWQIIQLLPSSFNQRATIKCNYEVLLNIYEWRKNHKLDEWRDFCKWIETLPYSELITGSANINKINNSEVKSK